MELEKINKTNGSIFNQEDILKIDNNTDKIQTELNTKANSMHTHTKSQITDFPTIPIIVALTATEYLAITTPDANTLYLIKEA